MAPSFSFLLSLRSQAPAFWSPFYTHQGLRVEGSKEKARKWIWKAVENPQPRWHSEYLGLGLRFVFPLALDCVRPGTRLLDAALDPLRVGHGSSMS